MPLAPEEFEPSEELKKLIEEAKRERDKPLEEIIRESELEIKASREQAPADVAIARQLHQSEGMRKFKEQYGEAWKFIQKKSSEEQAVEAYYRMQELNEKKRPKTAEDYAAIDAYTGSMAKAQGVGDSGGIDPIEVTKKTGADLVGMLGTAVDFAQRAVWRAPGYRFSGVADSWEEAWKLSKNGWSDDLVVSGWPAFLAYPTGIALETITDPLLILGLGVGIKPIAKKGAEELAKMQARYGILGKNVDFQLGIYLRGLSGKRSLYGIPHTEKIAKLLKEKIGLTRMLTPEREPIGEILKTLNTGLGDKEAAQASYLVQKAFRPYGDQLVMLKMEPEAMARASIAMEYVGHVRKGEGWAAQEFDQITMGDQYVQTAAELIYDGKKRMQDVVSELGLRYPDLTDTIRARKAAEVESRLNAFEKQKSRKWADVREVERRGTATQEVLGQIVGRETAKRAQIGELIGKEAERIGEYGQQRLGEAVSQYSKIEGTASRATEYVPAQQEYMKVAQPSTPQMPGSGIERAVTAGAREEAQTLLTPHKRLVQNLSLAENVAKKPIIPPSMEALKSRLTSLKEKGFDVKPELAFEAEKALDNARMLSGAIEKIQDMHPAELESLLKKSLTVGEYGQGLSPKTLGKGSKLIGELKGLMTARARLMKRAELLQQAVYKKIAVADAFSKMEKYDELLKRGAKFDQELAMSPAYSARISPTQRKGVAVASAEKEYIHHQKALSQSGAYQKRRFISEEGRSLYLSEIERPFREAIDDPKFLGEDLGEGLSLKVPTPMLGGKISRGYIRGALREMYNTPDLAKAVSMAKDEVGKGNFIMGRMFELNPVLSLPVEFSRIAKDVRTDSIKKGLLLVASDVQDAAHSVPAKEMGGDIAKMYPDKFFPVELGNELKEWDNALAEMQKTDNWALRLYDGMQGMWKQQATGLWPAFQFRNMLSDFARATTKGVFNPISVLRDGSRAAIRSHGLIDLGHFGKISGQDLHDLASAHGILGGYSEEIASSLPKWSSRPMRIISSGEDIRRIGYFADRIRRGQAPIQAARDTLEVFFDYKNLAGWEKSVMKRIFPWWTFRRKNIGFQIDKLLSQPWWTAAESRILRTRGQADEDSPDWVPDRLRGSTGVLVREDGITNIMYGMDMGGIQDIVGVLDSTGHPEGAFKGFLDNAWQELSPIPAFVLELAKWNVSAPGLSGIMSTGSDRELVDAPKGAENLPESFREYLEIRKEPETLGSGFREAWKMPKGSLKVMRSLRLFSETMKFMRYENTKSVPKNFVDNLTNFLTGLSKREITKTQIEEMLLRERYLTLIEHAKAQGLYERGRLILRGQQSEFGQEFKYYQQAYYDAYRRRLAEDDARREPPGQ